MKTRIIGDIHGMFNDYSTYTLDGVEQSIQVGDFAIGMGQSGYWHDKVGSFFKQNPQHRFIRGNHDNPHLCRGFPGFIADGTVIGEVMFIGGAWSIDKAWRTPGIDWWPEEECNDFDSLTEEYVIHKPRVMITHDAPISITDTMFVKSGFAMGGSNAISIKTKTGTWLQHMWEIYQPEEWYFGHWHTTMEYFSNGTRFKCLGINDYKDVDLNINLKEYKDVSS